MRHFLPAYVWEVRRVGLKPFKVFDVGAPFLVWAAFYVLCSNLNFGDLGSDNLFTATVVVRQLLLRFVFT